MFSVNEKKWNVDTRYDDTVYELILSNDTTHTRLRAKSREFLNFFRYVSCLKKKKLVVVTVTKISKFKINRKFFVEK